MATRAVSGSSTVPAPIWICSALYWFAKHSITAAAPGTVKVISRAVTPPSAQASAMRCAWSHDSARITATRPDSVIRTSRFHFQLDINSPLHCLIRKQNYNFQLRATILDFRRYFTAMVIICSRGELIA
jgi:hypothetical protein